ncbi:MAG: hypothetical protein JO371_03920 [Paraburkholderia sp.]|nr:hypothetical protein [Paraburkholderia sp.]
MGSGASTAGQPVSAASVMAGTVAVGAPMLGATVTILGANGQRVSASADAAGNYSNLDVSALTAPYRIQACGLADGQYQCYYAVVQAAGTANVTPLTDATVALAVGGNAASVLTTGAPSAAALSASEVRLQQILGPVLAAAGLTANSSFATLPFAANHTGMDKVLDAIKITSGQNNGVTFVQLEGVVGYGNAYLDASGAQAGSLDTASVVDGMGVDLSGISAIFSGMNSAIGSSSVSACTAAFAQVPIDPAFTLNMNGQLPLTAANAASSLCSYAATNGFLGGQVENPALRNCDFSGADKICTVGFNVVNGTLSESGSELAIVLRKGTSTWALLGEENPYGIIVGAAVERALSVNAAQPQPTYTRNIAIDIPTGVPSGVTAPHAARVYVHDNAGDGGWDTSAPIATLSDSGCTGQPSLTITGNVCGGEWLSLDRFNSSDLHAGDAFIDALYRRGRDLRVDLYGDTAATQFITSVYVRIAGVPPKSADLASVPWLNVDATTQAALAAYDSSTTTGGQLTVAWAANPVVIAHDLTVCGDSACQAEVHIPLSGSATATSATMNLSKITLTAGGYKRLSLYGRDRDDVGYQSDYLSCVSGTSCQSGG